MNVIILDHKNRGEYLEYQAVLSDGVVMDITSKDRDMTDEEIDALMERYNNKEDVVIMDLEEYHFYQSNIPHSYIVGRNPYVASMGDGGEIAIHVNGAILQTNENYYTLRKGREPTMVNIVKSREKLLIGGYPILNALNWTEIEIVDYII